MQSIIQACLSRSRTVLTLLAFLIFAGFLGYVSIPKESSPDVKIPIIYVSAHYEGMAPEDAERLIIKPLEQKLRSIEGVKEMKSTGYEGGANVLLEFFAGLDTKKAYDDVKDKVDQAKPDLPQDLKDISVNEVNLSLFPVLVVKLSGRVNEQLLTKVGDDLKNQIESRVPSVLKVNIVGKRDEQVEIIFDPARIENYRLSFEKVAQVLSRNNIVISAGVIDSGKGRFSVKVPGLIENVDHIMNLPLLSDGRAVVKFKDIARIQKTFKDPESFARDKGVPAIALEVSKRSGENIIATIAAVKEIVAQEKKFWPEGVDVNYSNDESDHIKNMLKDLQNSIISAVILVMAVITLSLGFRSALIVGVSIPGAFLTGILVIGFLGFTLNIVVLFSLILSVGMLVDGALIVVEYADRKMEEGMDKGQAYKLAAVRMVWPVITSIVTILLVFLPLLFWPGVVGQFMKFLPITLIATLAASILMGVIFVPTIGSLWGKLPEKHRLSHDKKQDANQIDRTQKLMDFYFNFLQKALQKPKKVLWSAVGVLVSVFLVYSFLGNGVEFFPDVEQEQAAIKVHARGNLSVFEKDKLLREVESRLFAMKYFKSIYSRSGSKGVEDSEDTVGIITVEFTDWQTRPRVKQVLKQVESATKDMAGIFVEVQTEKAGPSSGKPIKIELSSRDPKRLFMETKRLYQAIEKVTGLKGLENSLPMPGIQWQVEINRAEAAKFGADIATVGNAIKLATNGIKLSTYRPDDKNEEVDIVVRYPREARTILQLKNVRVQTEKGIIPITNFVTVKPVPNVSLIHRVDSQRIETIQTDVEPGVLVFDKLQELKKLIDSLNVHDDVRFEFKGEDKEQAETGAFLMKAFLVAIFLIFLVLLTQFNSFFRSALVLSAVVMSTFGVLIGLMIMRQPFGIVMGGIGVIALAGIIVSNNIILIDTFDQLFLETKDAYNSILRACMQRLRPVILTKLTVVLGLLPIMFGIDIDFINFHVTQGAPSTQWWTHLATCIVFGVLFASMLTLIVTPAALMVRYGPKQPSFLRNKMKHFAINIIQKIKQRF